MRRDNRCRALRGLALLACLIPSDSLPRAEDWPQWLGPRRDGINRETGWLKKWPRQGPPRLWQKSIGSGYSALAISRGQLILFHRIENEMRVDSLDPKTGGEQWRFSYPTDYEDRYGYDGGPRCCPIIHDGRVYTLGPKGVLHVIDLESGKKLRMLDLRAKYKLEENFFGTGATPIIEKGVLYAHLGGTDRRLGSGHVFAFDAGTGKLLWKTPTDGGSYASPVMATIGGTRQLFIFHRGGMSCIDPDGGRTRWMYPWYSRTDESVNASLPVVAGDILFFSATYQTGSVCLRVKKNSYEELWKDDLLSRDKILDIHWAPASYIDGHLYAFSGRHSKGSTLRCVELETGKLKWSWESYLYRGTMMYSDGHFIAQGEFGDLALLKLSPQGHEEVARLPRFLGYPAWTVPTLVDGLLYLRDLKRLVCFDLRVKKTGN